MKLYKALARAVGSLKRCQAADKQEWCDKHALAILELMKDAPSGSGIDRGTKLNVDSTGERLVFDASFHHMDEAGGYDGWTEHQVIVTAALELDYRLRITGPDRNSIKEYLADTYIYWLSQDVEDWAGYEPATKSTPATA